MSAVFDFMRQNGVLLKHPELWHICPPLHGQIHALPTLAGTLLAASDNLAYMRTYSGDIVLVHLSNFIKNKAGRVPSTAVKVKKEGKSKKELQDYLAMLGVSV